MLTIIENIDWWVMHFIQDNLKCGFLDFIMPKITMLGDGGIVWIATAVFLLFTKKYKKCGIMIIIGILIGFLIGNLWLKPLIARSRPCWTDSSVEILISMAKDFSFPSGHTLASVTAAVILTLNNRKFGFVAISLALLISFSRLYLYMHFPSDVLASFVLGTLISFFVFYFINKIHSKRKSKL